MSELRVLGKAGAKGLWKHLQEASGWRLGASPTPPAKKVWEPDAPHCEAEV